MEPLSDLMVPEPCRPAPSPHLRMAVVGRLAGNWGGWLVRPAPATGAPLASMPPFPADESRATGDFRSARDRRGDPHTLWPVNGVTAALSSNVAGRIVSR